MDDDPNDKEPYSDRDDFILRVGMALSPYQLIEEYLKFFIEVAHAKIQRLLLGRVPFRFPQKEYENAPLERLITMFARHCDNENLIARLRAAQKDRNYVAHKAIGHYMDHRDDDDSVKMFWELKSIEAQGYNLVEELQKELEKLKAIVEQ
jgi:hypothetical protein